MFSKKYFHRVLDYDFVIQWTYALLQIFHNARLISAKKLGRAKRNILQNEIEFYTLELVNIVERQCYLLIFMDQHVVFECSDEYAIFQSCDNNKAVKHQKTIILDADISFKNTLFESPKEIDCFADKFDYQMLLVCSCVDFGRNFWFD